MVDAIYKFKKNCNGKKHRGFYHNLSVATMQKQLQEIGTKPNQFFAFAITQMLAKMLNYSVNTAMDNNDKYPFVNANASVLAKFWCERTLTVLFLVLN